jgi:arginyl-tRNA synthetase
VPDPSTQPSTSPSHEITARFQRALGVAFGPEYADADPVIRPSQFADFQANASLALAKRLGSNPREVATRLVEALEVDDVASSVEISGPGFVNVTLRPSWLAGQVTALAADPRLGVPEQEQQVVPID